MLIGVANKEVDMKKVLLITLLMFQIFGWDNAKTMGDGRFKVGIFSPLEYGVNDDLDISFAPLGEFIMPNVGLKKRWFNTNLTISTIHQIIYPTIMLDIISRRGTGGVLPDTFKPNYMLNIDNGLLITYTIKQLDTTFKIRHETTINPNTNMPTIDYPIIYNRTISYSGIDLFNLGIDIDYNMGYFGFLVDFDLFLLNNGYKIYEHKSYIVYDKRFLLGYKYFLGQMPYGDDSKLFLLIDYIWNW